MEVELEKLTYVTVVELPEALPSQIGCVSQSLLNDRMQQTEQEVDSRTLLRLLDSPEGAGSHRILHIRLDTSWLLIHQNPRGTQQIDGNLGTGLHAQE